MPVSLACVVGARPNFVKIGPILRALAAQAPDVRPVLIHTGQHYDEAMSDLFFRQLGLPHPDVHLEVGSGGQGEQTAKILARYETWLLSADPRPAATLVVGDVNSTMACGLASVKLGIPLIHVEAGLRSFDRAMPEEINRVVTDAISDLLLVSEPSGIENLRKEGRPDSMMRLVGNVMIDVLHAHLPVAQAKRQWEQFGLKGRDFALWTMHRPSNVDDPATLINMIEAMRKVASRLPVIFPCHPRTQARLAAAGIWDSLTENKNMHLTPPLGYLEFLSLSQCAKVIVTDSGGLQEESTVLGIPCITLRENTERPVTVTGGTSTLVGRDTALAVRLIDEVLAGKYKHGGAPPLWDGHAGERMAPILAEFVQQ